jgi:hypothetical protein
MAPVFGGVVRAVLSRAGSLLLRDSWRLCGRELEARSYDVCGGCGVAGWKLAPTGFVAVVLSRAGSSLLQDPWR